MRTKAQMGPASGDRLRPQSAPGVDALWELVREQQARIERLESGLLPLPGATDREQAGRRRVPGNRDVRRAQSLHEPLSAIEAFQSLAPITAKYATLPIMQGFNWQECAARLDPGEWHMIVFRSIRREAIDDLTLEMHDYGAYIEAQRRAIGLVFYFRGTPNEHRECLSFCIWSSRAEAARAARLPLHREAMTMVDEKYEWYALERYLLRTVRGRRGIEAIPVDAEGRPITPN
jgi:hypothetical protein